MGLAISISQIEPFVPPVLTIIGSFVLFHYSQRYSLQKGMSDIIGAIIAKTKMEFIKGEIKNVLQIKEDVEFIKFTLQFIYFIISFLTKIYYFPQKINISSSTYAIATFVGALSSYAFIYFLVFLIFFNVCFIILSFLDLKMKKARRRNYLLYILYISSYSTTSDLRWGSIFYLSFYSYFYVTLFKLNINSIPFALDTFLIFYLFILIPSAFPMLERLLLDLIADSDKRIFTNTESLIFNDASDRPKIRVQVGSTLYEGKVKKIDKNLVIVSVDKELKEHEIHIRWEAIQAFEVIELKQNSMEKLYFM